MIRCKDCKWYNEGLSAEFPYCDYHHTGLARLSGCDSGVPKTKKSEDSRPAGKWENVEVTDVRSRDAIGISSIASMRCSVCHRYHNEVYFYGEPTEFARFCPNCGADMREEN